jgi:hypothetical protein
VAGNKTARGEHLAGMLGGAGAVLLLDGLILWVAVQDKNINAWWFFVSTNTGFVLAALAWLVYDYVTRKVRREIWIPLEFLAFALVTYFVALLSGAFKDYLASIFNTPSTEADYAFFALNLIPTSLLFGVYLLRRKARMKGRPDLAKS